MARSAHYEGGLNTLQRQTAAGGTRAVGVIPKKGKIVSVHYAVTAAQATAATVLTRIWSVDGATSTDLHAALDLQAAFSTGAAGRAGTMPVITADQDLLNVLPGQLLEAVITGVPDGDLNVRVSFEPR